MKSLIILETSTISSMNIFKIWETQGISNFLISLLSGLLIVIISWIVLKLIVRSINVLLKKANKVSELMASYILKIISGLGWIIIAITFLQHIGIDMAPLIAGLGITGIVLGLAFQDSLSNFFAGAMLVINQPFRKGDYIEVNSLAGSVVSMDLMCIILNTFDGKRVTMANKLVWGAPITNFSYTEKRGVSMTISVPYDSDLKLCKQIFKEILDSYEEILSDPIPIIEVHSLSESSIDFLIRPWVSPQNYWKVFWRFNAEVVPKLRENGVEIPFPQLDVHFDK